MMHCGFPSSWWGRRGLEVEAEAFADEVLVIAEEVIKGLENHHENRWEDQTPRAKRGPCGLFWPTGVSWLVRRIWGGRLRGRLLGRLRGRLIRWTLAGLSAPRRARRAEGTGIQRLIAHGKGEGLGRGL